ncbi:MAG: hypothetical protein KA735_13865 [Burkholderiaceae bacterium]|nr:hypothetical protein [Burkholderiaceae bacterium]
MLTLLGSIQMGYAFYIKRELQKAADLAALSGVQMFVEGTPQECQAAQEHAKQIARLNFPGLGDIDDPICEVWSQDTEQAPGEQPGYNALRVSLDKEVMTLVPFTGIWSVKNVQAVAATSEPVATFSVGSRLLSLGSGGLVGQLLKAVGLPVDTLNVLDSGGLAVARITPSGLLKQLHVLKAIDLGAGTPQELLGLKPVSLLHFIQASALVLGNSNDPLVKADVGRLEALALTLTQNEKLTVPIPLFGDKGIFAAVDLTQTSGALNALVDVASLITTSVIVANGDNMLDLDLSSAGLNVVAAGVRIVEPPTIAIGGKGTTAHSAQIRIYLGLTTDQVPLVGPLLNATRTHIDLPLIIDVGHSMAEITNMCQRPDLDNVAFEVHASVVNICIGRFAAMGDNRLNPAEFLSSTNECSAAAVLNSDLEPYPHSVLDVLGLINVRSRVALAVLSAPPETEELTAPPSTKTIGPSSLDLSATTQAVVDAVVGGLLGDVIDTTLGKTQSNSVTPDEQRDLVKQMVARGDSISKVVNGMQWSKNHLNALSKRLANNGLLGVLGGTLQGVGQVLNTILLAPLADTICVATNWTQEQLHECRIDAVNTLLFSSLKDLVAGVVGIVISLLDPILDPLSALLNSLLQLLGIQLSETDLTLYSVQCGGPRLVE